MQPGFSFSASRSSQSPDGSLGISRLALFSAKDDSKEKSPPNPVKESRLSAIQKELRAGGSIHSFLQTHRQNKELQLKAKALELDKKQKAQDIIELFHHYDVTKVKLSDFLTADELGAVGGPGNLELRAAKAQSAWHMPVNRKKEYIRDAVVKGIIKSFNLSQAQASAHFRRWLQEEDLRACKNIVEAAPEKSHKPKWTLYRTSQQPVSQSRRNKRKNIVSQESSDDTSSLASQASSPSSPAISLSPSKRPRAEVAAAHRLSDADFKKHFEAPPKESNAKVAEAAEKSLLETVPEEEDGPTEEADTEFNAAAVVSHPANPAPPAVSARPRLAQPPQPQIETPPSAETAPPA